MQGTVKADTARELRTQWLIPRDENNAYLCGILSETISRSNHERNTGQAQVGRHSTGRLASTSSDCQGGEIQGKTNHHRAEGT